MSMLQHYYTSYANRQTGSAGFQVKAMSPGISPDTQTLILRLIAYRIPSTLDERNIATHPIALRYYYESAQRCFLLCSQSNGADDNGRPGNFFAHTLIADPESFKLMPPIFYWRSPSWCSRDSGTGMVLPTLSQEEEMEATLDSDDVWDFLRQGKRLDYFYRLMCAVVHAQSSRRRIVIIDSADNVALWVAAVSMMLPPDYRPLLSFATYHHDPYQTQFMITGTTTDSSFRATADEYISFFVLNTEINKISEVEDSPYAKEVAQAARSPEEFDQHLLSLFDNYVCRFPVPAAIDEQLDQMVRYAHLLARREQVPLSPEELQAIATALTTFEQSTHFTSRDIDEIRKLSKALNDAWLYQEDEAVSVVHQRILQLQKTHKLPTDELVLSALRDITINIGRKRSQTVLDSTLRVHGEDLFVRVLNSRAYWDWLPERGASFEVAAIEKLADFLTYLGPYIRIGQVSEQFFLGSLQRLGRSWQEGNRKESRLLYSAIAETVKGREKELLVFAVERDRLLPQNTLQRLYCRLVYPFDLEKRALYRTIVQRALPNIALSELDYQIGKGGPHNGLSEFERWILYAKQQRMEDITVLLERGLQTINSMGQQYPDQWHRLASGLLTSKVLMPLPQKWEDRLVEAVLSSVSLNHYTPAEVEMCEKYRNREGISVEQRVVMNGLIAMKYGRLNAELGAQLRQRFERLVTERPQQGKEEAESFVGEFMAHVMQEPSHNLMVNVVLCNNHAWKNFWHPYWNALYAVMTDVKRAEQAINILGCWFMATPTTFTVPYTLHYFFLRLPQTMERWQKERRFLEARLSMMSILDERDMAWSPLARDLLVGQKDLLAMAGQNIAAMGQSLAVRLRRSIDSKYANQQDVRAIAERHKQEEFALNIEKLFSKKNIREIHWKNLQAVYQSGERDMFWECYWQQVIQLMVSQNPLVVLDLLAFWFDDGYNVFSSECYLVPEFFLGFADAIAAVRKERKFAEHARKINEHALKRHQQYRWYGLVKEYFLEPERKGRLPLFRPQA